MPETFFVCFSFGVFRVCPCMDFMRCRSSAGVAEGGGLGGEWIITFVASG